MFSGFFKNVSLFQIGSLVLFVMLAFLGLILMGNYRGKSAVNVPETIVWGTISEAKFAAATDMIRSDTTVKITYVKKDAVNFSNTLISAIADGVGPDVVVLPFDSLYRQKDRLLQIPFQSFSQREYKNTFVQGSELYITPNGILGFPLVVDPLVMYWNRDIFNTNNLVAPPTTWEEFLSLGKEITRRDTNNNIVISAVALGDYTNITNAKEILAALLFQSGISLVRLKDGGYESDLGFASNGSSVLNFYTQFSNPLNQVYSWNHGLPISTDYFLANKLALYFGFASEIEMLRSKNPNLNFDVASFPQLKSASVNITFGKIYGVSVLKSSRNQNQSIIAVGKLTSKSVVDALSKRLGMAPSRRDLLSVEQIDPFQQIFAKAALQAQTWFDPDPIQTDLVLKTAVESVVSGVSVSQTALLDADQKIKSLLR